MLPDLLNNGVDLVRLAEIAEDLSRMTMFRPKLHFENHQSSLVQFFRIGISALPFIKRREIICDDARIEVFRPSSFFERLQRTLIKLFCLAEISLAFADTPQVIRGLGGLGMIVPQQFFLDLQCPRVQWHGFGIFTRTSLSECQPSFRISTANTDAVSPSTVSTLTGSRSYVR